MNIRLYSVHDKLLGVYLAPFAARAHVEAMRQMKHTLADPQMVNSNLVTNPGDFDLVYVATMDDETGLITYDSDQSGNLPFIVCELKALTP